MSDRDEPKPDQQGEWSEEKEAVLEALARVLMGTPPPEEPDMETAK